MRQASERGCRTNCNTDLRAFAMKIPRKGCNTENCKKDRINSALACRPTSQLKKSTDGTADPSTPFGAKSAPNSAQDDIRFWCGLLRQDTSVAGGPAFG